MNTGTTGDRQIGRYQVLGELGRGAMGVVYRGFDPVIRRTVALKTIAFASDDADSKALRERLYREAAAAGTLTHPNIVTVYDIIDDGASTAVAMEFVEGQTLADLLSQRGALAVDEALAIFEQVCSALDYAGSKGIVHRDIKPANILMTADGRPKIMDFGIARMALQGVTQTSTIMGSPSYMSPEQVRGLKLDPRSDLFSAAVVFYEMVAGSRPFGGDDVATTMYRIVNEPPRALDLAAAAVNPAVADVLGWALAKDPAERYATGAELVTAIRGAMAGGAVQRAPLTEATIVVPRTPAASPSTVFDGASVPESAVAPGAPRSRALLYAVIGSGAIFVIILAIVLFGGLGTSTTAPPAGGGGAPLDSGPAPAPAPTAAAPAPAQPAAALREAKASAKPAAAVTAPAARNAPAATPPRAVEKSIATPATALPAPPPMPSAAASAQQPKPTTPPAATAQGAPAQASATAQPAAPVLTPPSAPAATPAAETTSAVFAVSGNDYTGVRVLVDNRQVPGSGPFQMNQIAVGPHKVTYKWVSGPLNGREIEDTLTFAAGGVNRVRALPDTSKIDVQFLARR